jgi:hypothetical protein
MHVVDDPEFEQARKEWMNGGSALPIVRLFLERGEADMAAAMARAALGRPPCADAEEIERLLDTLDDSPEDWDDRLRELVAEPTLEGWRDLLQFVPADALYQRTQNSIRRLRALGLPGNWLFLFGCEYGLTSDAVQLVEDGLVDVATLEERAGRAGDAKTTYLGLAATAAFLAGDVVATIRLLRESAANANEFCSPDPHILFIREHATPEILEALDRAGIPEAFDD